MKKVYFIIIVALFTAKESFSQDYPQTAPINPDYLEYLEKKQQGLIQKTTDEGYRLGEIPSPVMFNFDHAKIKVDKEKEFDVSYDLRTINDGNWLTPARDQGNWGSCWAFATYGAIESYLLKTGNPEHNLSEQNLATCHGFDLGGDDGGNYHISTAYLSRWDGPISEDDDPYGTYEENCNEGYTPVAHVNQARFLPGIEEDAFDEAIVKQAIMDYGAIYVNMRWDGNYYNSVDYTFFYDGGGDTNHAVLLVGWDNNKAVTGGDDATPSEEGAWIIKNSWGTEWGEDGFFYISYEDTKTLSNIAYFPSFEDYNPEAQVHYYDKLGATGAYGWGESGEGNAYGIAKFTASQNQQIEKIGTYSRAINTNIDIEIYESFDGSEPTNLIGIIEDLECDWPGYYIFELNTPIEANEGDDFFVKVKYDTGTDHPIPVENIIDDYSSEADIQPEGIYWVSNDGVNWFELGTNYDRDYNISIRAYTIPENGEDTYTLTLNAEPEAGGTVEGDGSYEEGEEVTVTATANEGYKFFNWTDENDDEISNNASFTYAMPAFDAQLTANFDKLYIITFEIEDEDGVTIDDATVTLNGAENDPGQYVFDDIVVGTYEYTVKKENYFTVVDEVEVSDEDVTVDVTMELITYTASFDVVDEDGNTIDDATITFDEVENEAGDYVFENIEPGTYNYEVKHTDYFTVEDEVKLVDDDITKNVEMKIDDTFVETPSDVELEIFPNPARNNINITADITINKVEIIDITGNVVYNKAIEDMEIRISTADLDTGLYILRIHTDDRVFVEKVQVQR